MTSENANSATSQIVTCDVCGQKNRVRDSSVIAKCGNCHRLLLPAIGDVFAAVEDLISQGNKTDARDVLQRFVAGMPSNWTVVTETVNEIGEWYERAFWDTEEFLEYSHYISETGLFTKGISHVWPSYPRAFERLAYLAVEEGSLLEALQILDRGLALEPDHPLLLCEKGLVLGNLKRLDESLVAYQQALTLRPWSAAWQKARALRGQGVTLIDVGRLDEAEAALNQSLEYEPDNAVAKKEIEYIRQMKRRGVKRGGQSRLVRSESVTERSSEQQNGESNAPAQSNPPTMEAPAEELSPEWFKETEEKARKHPRVFNVISGIMREVLTTPIDRREALSNITETLDILELAITARDKPKAFEAVSNLLLQFLQCLQDDNAALGNTLPLLEEFKDRIVAGDFAEALSYTQAFRAMFRN